LKFVGNHEQSALHMKNCLKVNNYEHGKDALSSYATYLERKKSTFKN